MRLRARTVSRVFDSCGHVGSPSSLMAPDIGAAGAVGAGAVGAGAVGAGAVGAGAVFFIASSIATLCPSSAAISSSTASSARCKGALLERAFWILSEIAANCC